MNYIVRTVEAGFRHALARGRSVLLLGARQTGKTTLVQRLPARLRLSLVPPDVRLRYERDPGLLCREIEALADVNTSEPPLVILDEVQKVPELLDAAQDLIDRKVAQTV